MNEDILLDVLVYISFNVAICVSIRVSDWVSEKYNNVCLPVQVYLNVMSVYRYKSTLMWCLYSLYRVEQEMDGLEKEIKTLLSSADSSDYQYISDLLILMQYIIASPSSQPPVGHA